MLLLVLQELFGMNGVSVVGSESFREIKIRTKGQP